MKSYDDLMNDFISKVKSKNSINPSDVTKILQCLSKTQDIEEEDQEYLIDGLTEFFKKKLINEPCYKDMLLSINNLFTKWGYLPLKSNGKEMTQDEYEKMKKKISS